MSTRIDGAVTDEELERSLSEYHEMMMACQSQQVRIVSFIEKSGVGNVTARERRRQGQWYRETEPLTREVTLGMAYIAPGAVTRGLLTAVFWFSPPVVQCLVCATMQEALTWAYSVCEQHGVAISESARVQSAKCFSE